MIEENVVQVLSGSSHGRLWSLRVADARQALPGMASGSVDCLVSSPPYYWQRDYGMADQIGMEDTVEGYVSQIVAVMAEGRRMLHPRGTAFLVIGDTYYSGKGRSGGEDGKQSGRRFAQVRAVERAGFGLPRKSLIGVPWRLALALQADGWTLRSAIVWRKGHGMEQPRVFDRPWCTTETILMLSKGISYHFDRSALEGDEDVWDIPANNALRGQRHAAPFPIALASRCIAIGCIPGGRVLDPFAGSGTTLLAAARSGRDSIGVELNPDYARMAASRLAGG